MSGRPFARYAEKRGIAKPPFILLTGWGGQELEKEKITESGVDAVVAKPIDSGDIACYCPGNRWSVQHQVS